jgi:hypothetical protein
MSMMLLQEPLLARAKPLILVKKLLPLLKSGQKICTYRTRPLSGYYYVITSRFRCKRTLAECLIEVTGSEKIGDYKSLSDQDANYAGLASARDLIDFLASRYAEQKLKASLYRNWIRVVNE